MWPRSKTQTIVARFCNKIKLGKGKDLHRIEKVFVPISFVSRPSIFAEHELNVKTLL